MPPPRNVLTSSFIFDKVKEINDSNYKDDSMKTFKWPAIIAVLTSLIIFVYLLFKQSLTIQSLSDTFFIGSLFFLIIGIGLWILSSGSFDFFQRSMKKAFKLRKKQELEDYTPLSKIGKEHYSFWLKTGSLLLIISFIFLFFYFI